MPDAKQAAHSGLLIMRVMIQDPRFTTTRT